MASDAPLYQDASIFCPPLSLITFASSNNSAFTNDTLLFLVIDNSLLFAILGCFLFFIIGSSPLFAIFGCFLSIIASDSLLSAVFGYFLSSVASDSLLSTVFGGGVYFP